MTAAAIARVLKPDVLVSYHQATARPLPKEVVRVRNASECYHGLREASALPYRTVARWVKAFRAGRNVSVDLHSTGGSPIPQHQIDIVSGFLSIDHLWTVRKSSVEVGLSHQTAWHKL
ncbi:hypothetical protein AVEN_174228-1 [Araneus ventricosus]|uniref:Mos1 transposase HTH domain-containing protein n=1 Tax=Araneus ventricosus TaxID=182803 RepID=A0A4Y2W4H6_ARAVE|nr:hypothetical protein AVEN_22130-1 [Araneus ventricosus]GBO31892.1 hypothetical protein AVEN_24386-1 [Araneus ventricosus]GBO31899.1 hypothetical protein AVEN_115788-1 [Araneus ventricosus]GBO31902.1 hypothetical protein AVEN_174228-1 [Araneus ventricosus]